MTRFEGDEFEKYLAQHPELRRIKRGKYKKRQ